LGLVTYCSAEIKWKSSGNQDEIKIIAKTAGLWCFFQVWKSRWPVIVPFFLREKTITNNLEAQNCSESKVIVFFKYSNNNNPAVSSTLMILGSKNKEKHCRRLGKQMKTIAKPMKTITKPMKTITEPMETITKPMQTITKPIKTITITRAKLSQTDLDGLAQ